MRQAYLVDQVEDIVISEIVGLDNPPPSSGRPTSSFKSNASDPNRNRG